VEAGVTSGTELFSVAEEYLAPLKAADIDTLILGCTHYPLMSAAIQYVMGSEVTLVSSAEETAFDVYRTLVKHNLERQSTDAGTHLFEATGPDKAAFKRLASRFLGPEVVRVENFDTGTIVLPRRETR
jgi:glutamate racemase